MIGIFGSSGCLICQWRKKVLPRDSPVPPTALVQVPLKPLQQVLGKAVLQPAGPGVLGGGWPDMCPWVGPHAPSFGRQLWKAAQLFGVSLTTGGIAPASLRYVRLSVLVDKGVKLQGAPMLYSS